MWRTSGNAEGRFPLQNPFAKSKFICQQKTHFLHAKIDCGGGFEQRKVPRGPCPFNKRARGAPFGRPPPTGAFRGVRRPLFLAKFHFWATNDSFNISTMMTHRRIDFPGIRPWNDRKTSFMSPKFIFDDQNQFQLSQNQFQQSKSVSAVNSRN